MSICWGPTLIRKDDGYSIVFQELYKRVKHLDVLLAEDYIDEPGSTVEMDLVIGNEGGFLFSKAPPKENILINFYLPQVDRIETNYLVAFVFWETSRLPPDWVDVLNQCNEVWTCSAWARNVFIESGVRKPVYNFDLGFNSEDFPIKTNFQRGSKPFTFLNIGGNSHRKNNQLVVDAFLKLFEDNMDYQLILKTTGAPASRWTNKNGEYIGGFYGHPQIKIIDSYLNESEMSDLYKNSDCFLYPTSGEGWGMSPFNAIASGIPTICTNATACTEFAYLSYPLDSEYVKSTYPGVFENGEIAMPSFDDLCDKMMFIVNNHDEAIAKTNQGAKFLHENYSWDKVSEKYISRLKELKAVYDN